MRLLFAACSLFAFMTQVFAEPHEPQNQLRPLEIRLPSITKRWKRPEGGEGPDITIDDIEQCMGQNVGMQWGVNELKQEQSQLEDEQAHLVKVHEALAQNSRSLEARQHALQERIDLFQTDSAGLARRILEIEKRKNAVSKTKPEIDKTNQLVAAYNVDVAKHNGLRPALLHDQEAFSQAVDGHNDDVAHANQMVAKFNERNGGFQGRAAELASKSAEYNASCAGERVLHK